MSKSIFPLPLRPRINLSYVGHLATRTRCCTDIFDNGSTGRLNARTYHYARDNITRLKIAWGQWYAVAQAAESNAGGAGTLSAGIEYPSGTFTQVKFGGANTISVSNGATQYSDWITVNIPIGAKFYVRLSLSARFFPYNDPTNNNITDYLDQANGDAKDSSGTDKSVSGTITDDGSNIGFFPLAIIGPTSRPSFSLLGDSRVHGYGDTLVANVGDIGYMEKSLAPNFGLCNFGVISESALNWTGSNRNKSLAVAKYCSHLNSALGHVDLLQLSRTAAQIETSMETVMGLFAPRPRYQDTWLPYSSSTNGWINTANQTTDTTNTTRNTCNTFITGSFTPYSTNITDAAAAIESAAGSGKWVAPGGVAQTADGIHPNAAGTATMKAANLYPPSNYNITPELIEFLAQTA